MYHEVGQKIKKWAEILVIIDTIIFITLGVLVCAYFFSRDEMLLGLVLAVLVVLVGYFISWLSHLLLYAFGELVDRTISIDDALQLQERRYLQKIKQQKKEVPAGQETENH
ncbi:MAG: hypothetical protein IJ375_07650 [Oscillospiraceae bacterium]|nr:hypothetical protein [Oscillospiraceae bacterium]